MERFSNNREKYWNQVKKELLESNDSEDFRFQYLEMGQLMSHGFSVTLIKRNPKVLVFKIWNAKYDNKRFDKGIFNLSRLAITDRNINMNSLELEVINRLLDSELGRTNYKAVILDGLFCQFETNGRIIDWNTDESINDHLTELVEFLRNKTGHNNV